MYEVYTVDILSDPNFEELISFDDLAVALAFSKVRILFSSTGSCSAIWEVLEGKRRKLYRTFWKDLEPITIEPGHELWCTDVLLSILLEIRRASSGVQKRSRKRWANSFPAYKQS